MSTKALKGHLDMLVLAVLADGPKHGYSVIEALRERSDQNFDLPEGTVYPALHRLEKSGHLESDWSVVQGRRRRTYRLTNTGTAGLKEQAAAWSKLNDAVDSVMRGVPWPATP